MPNCDKDVDHHELLDWDNKARKCIQSRPIRPVDMHDNPLEIRSRLYHRKARISFDRKSGELLFLAFLTRFGNVGFPAYL